MCTVCGCGDGETRVAGAKLDQEHDHPHSHDHVHPNAHNHSHPHTDDLNHDSNNLHHYGKGPAHAHAPGMSQTRMVQIEQDILGKNQRYANTNREALEARGIFTLNLVSSPGSGKTTLLTKTLHDLKDKVNMAVIEGDQETNQDAERIRKTGVPAIQINTGKGCHLDAHMVGHAIEKLPLKDESLLFIENVGNLVCPAAFDLGEAHKVAILSVTEGEDKPIKYPDMFYAADLMLLNKVDLLPYLDFDVEKCISFAKQVNPKIQILQVSATKSIGMQQWYQWLELQQKSRNIGRVTQPVSQELNLTDEVNSALHPHG